MTPPVIFMLLALLAACYRTPGACPRADERMGADILGTERSGGGACHLTCADGARLGSREGMWAIDCGEAICAPDVYDDQDTAIEGDTVCGYGADVEAWLEASCPDCTAMDTHDVRGYQWSDEDCAFEYRHRPGSGPAGSSR